MARDKVAILAFDTSYSNCSVGLMHNDQYFTLEKLAPMKQGSLLLPMINELLQNASLAIESLSHVAYGCGPGSFTGIRIANSVAQGLGFALDLPLIPVSSMAILAQSAYQIHGWTRVLVSIDARMDQVYAGLYQLDGSSLMQLVGKEMLCLPDELPSPADNYFAVGDGWRRYPVLAQERSLGENQIDVDIYPHAEALLALAHAASHQKEGQIDAINANPHYLR